MTKTEMVKILDDIIVLVDSREKANSHIIKYFEARNIKYKIMKLNYGDYSCVVKINDQIIDFRKIVTVERKNSIDEVTQNFGKNRERFIKEFARSKGKIYLMLEDCCYSDIIYHRYNSAMHPKALIGSIKSFEVRYGMSTDYINKRESGHFIYYTLRYFVKEYLKELEGGGQDGEAKKYICKISEC